ncbi:hypothetical protein N7532_003473 [Penicillium argentinense]|uniref:Uncharacterized protein n=1 Tax=Penicillium argentinense TaxID=1131581 RepID=A0A9W9KE14_9EURO|nr:uncharacterized protein N7532_003473 [Penicillium argentinense]KAJ5102944.1 hypothetical protein N7532_003473 [Penicillium argentinense]
MFGWGPGLALQNHTLVPDVLETGLPLHPLADPVTASPALPSASSEPERERKPPTDPTPLDFPVYHLPQPVPESECTLQELFGLLASIKRPQDISLDRFKPLNLQVESDVDVRRMFPDDQAQSLAPLPWDDEPEIQPESSEPPSRPLMSNGLPYPPKERFEILRKELLLDNDDTFREMARLPPREGRTRVRVTQSRKFWTGLERVAQYWDSSLDNYFDRPASPTPTPPSNDDGSKEDKMQTDDATPASGSGHSKMDVDQPEAAAESNGTAEDGTTPHPSVRMYTGRRIGSGTEMPDELRDETIRAFVEMAAWPFGCQVCVPTLPPRLTVKSLLFPVRQSFQVARSPRDRQVARNGILEGPVLIAQCRPETAFRATGDDVGGGIGEVCDLFREVGGMLLAAQERAREGATELRPGEGKWWTTRPRFGGAPNDHILDDLVKGHGMHGMPLPDSMLGEGKSEPSVPAQEVESARKRHKFEHPFVTSLSRKPSAMRKLSSGEKWKILQPGPSLWDKRMRYMQIGKVPESPYDDIYMVSSINHHISILHLRIHKRYLQALTFGESDFPAEPADTDHPWHVLKLQRSRWYDLLDANDRVDGLKCVWRLFHYQLRKV